MTVEELLNIGSRIRYYREKCGYSQTFMAEEVLKIPRSTYSNYENNNRSPDISTLLKISEVLGIEVNELLEEKHFLFDISKDNVFSPIVRDDNPMSFRNTVNEKSYEMIDHYLNNTGFSVSDNRMTSLEFYNADKYLKDFMIEIVMSTVERFCQDLQYKIMNDPNSMVPNNEIEHNQFFYGKGTSIIDVTYEIGKKEENEDYLEYIVEDHFHKLMKIYDKNTAKLDSKEAIKKQLIKNNESLAQIIKNLNQNLLKKIKSDSIKLNDELPLPDYLQNSKEGD